MPESGDNDRGEIVAGLVDSLFEALNVVVVEMDQVGPVLGRHSRERRRAPRHGAMIGSARHKNLAPPGSRTGKGNAGGRGVCAVLL